MRWTRARSTARRRALAAATSLALVGALAGCSSSGDQTAPTPTTSEPSVTGDGSPATDPPDPTSPPPIAVDRMSRDRLAVTTVPLKGGGGPDWMATGFGSLWVKRDDNVVVRLSPDGKVLATYAGQRFEQPVCQGLGVGEQAVWACANPGRLMRIDPKTDEVTIVRIPKVNEQGRLVAYDGKIWVLTGDGDELVGLSESDNRAGPTIDLGAFCTDVADTVQGSTLWVACPYDGVALRVDLDAEKVTGRVTGLPGAVGVSVAKDVWVCTKNGIARVDVAAMAVVGTQRFPSGLSCSLRAYDDAVWVRTGYRTSPFVGRIDPATGSLVQVITTDGRISGGDVIEYDHALWVSSYEEGVVFKLRRPEV